MRKEREGIKLYTIKVQALHAHHAVSTFFYFQVNKLFGNPLISQV